MKLKVEELRDLSVALEDVYGYLTDNSCSDPDCCGGPFYFKKDYDAGLEVMNKYGLELNKD